MAYTQEYVNQLIQEAAAQAGGSLSYADVANAAANLGIPLSQVDAAMSAGAPVSEVVSRVEATGLTIQPNDYSQAYVDQLVKEAAAQAGGTLSYEDAVRAATNLGIPSSLLQDSIASGLITAAPTTTTTSAAPTEGVVSDTALKNWIDSNAGATTGQLYTAALNQGIGLDQFQRVTGLSTQDLLKEQILSTSDSSQWSGEGFGSAEANARDMAKILAEIGITDIRQFGQFEVPDSKEVPVVQESNEWSGSGTGAQTLAAPLNWYFVNGAGDKVYVDPNTVYSIDAGLGDGSTQDVVSIPSTKVVYGNKDTKQAVPNTYSERQTGNAWGGTFAGDGNTGYRVQFAPDGTPVFYTTGASSSDLGDLAPFLAIGSLAVAPWLSTQIGALTGLTGAGLSAATGATIGAGGTLLTGGSLEDALRNALIAGAAGYGSGMLSGQGVGGANMSAAEAADFAAGLNPDLAGDYSWLFNTPNVPIAMPSTAQGVPIVESPTDMFITGTAPINIPAIVGGATGGFLNALPSSPNLEVVSKRPVDTSVSVGGGVGGLLSSNITTPSVTTDLPGTGQNLEVVGEKPKTTPPSVPITETPVIPPIITTPIDIPKIQAPKDVTVKDVIDTIGAAGTVAGLVDSATSGDKGFDIVDIPSEWRTPTYGVPGGSAWPRLTPIDFGTRELLRGTQWERFINQPVAQIPVVQPQQMNMSYADLVSALQGNQGPRLTIGDIISGIQGQYGQVNPSAMG